MSLSPRSPTPSAALNDPSQQLGYRSGKRFSWGLERTFLPVTRSVGTPHRSGVAAHERHIRERNNPVRHPDGNRCARDAEVRNRATLTCPFLTMMLRRDGSVPHGIRQAGIMATKRAAIGATILSAAILAGGAATAVAAVDDLHQMNTGPNTGVRVRAAADVNAPIITTLGANQLILGAGVVAGGPYGAVCGADGAERWRVVDWYGKTGYVAYACLLSGPPR